MKDRYNVVGDPLNTGSARRADSLTEPRDFSPRPDRLADRREFDAMFAEIFSKADDGKAKA